MNAVTELRINLEFVEIVGHGSTEVRATMPDVFDDYRLMLVLPTSLFRSSETITKMVEGFCVELARQWLCDGGMKIVETHTDYNPTPDTTGN